MDSKTNERADEQPVSETPEDVAILYSWANLHGAKYRDFSASRREYRAQLRHRAAEAVREQELKAQAEAEAAATEAERVARDAEESAQKYFAEQDALSREQSLRAAEDAARVAAAERVEAARRAEAAAAAEAAARREEHEMAQAHASAQRQAQRYNESDIRRRDLAGPQPSAVVHGLITDPYTPSSSHPEFYGDNASSTLDQPRQRPSRDRNDLSILLEAPARRPVEEPRRRPEGFRPDESSGYRPSYRPSVTPPEAPPYRAPVREARQEKPIEPREYIPELRPDPVTEVRPSAGTEPQREYRQDYPPASTPAPRTEYAAPRQVPTPTARPYTENPVGPAWLYAPQTPLASPPVSRQRAAVATPVVDTLQHSRERVAARWFALKGVFDQPGTDQPDTQAMRQQKEARVPLVAVFSLAGGVGKTSLVATLGRTLSALGERVILTDTTSHGLLPFYFGASELRPGVVRTFSPPQGSMDAPISLVSYDIDHSTPDQTAQDRLVEEFFTNSRGSNRTILDLSGSSGWVIRRVARMAPTVLIPVAPDMNSVISLQAVEKFFAGMQDSEGHPIQPSYLLNQFDASLPLHLDVREVLRRQLGDRLLPFVIRRSPSVSEALAEGMTVIDYAPDSPVSEDYLNVANWVRKVSAPASAGFRNVRWSER